MNRQEFWAGVFVAMVPHRNCEECGAIADMALAEYDKRFGAVPLPNRSDLESHVRKERP